jgi:hypothetical protein
MWWRAGPYLIEPNSISVSGVSSGAAMVRSGFPTYRIGQTTLRVTQLHGWLAVVHQQAIQLHVAYSQTFIGMGAIAGGPYFCTRATSVLRKPQHSPRTHARTHDARNTRHDTTRCDGQSCAGGDVHGHAQPDQVPAIAALIPQ